LSLTRRRSLVQTPGVATRNSPVEGRRKTWNSWKAPKLAPEEEAKWIVTSKGISPLNRPVALDLAEERSPSPRAQTPGELDYSHLGSLKLGSLSIVNGAPSPAPSTRNLHQKSRLATTDDYFTAAEAESSPLAMKFSRRRGHAKSKSSVLPETALLYDDIPRLPAIDRDAYPLPTFDVSHEINNQPSRSQSQMGRIERQQTPDNKIVAPSQDASKYAQDYQADIPDSPFVNVDKVSREEEDEGFLSDDTIAFKAEATRLLAGTIFDAPASAIDTCGSALFSATSYMSASDKQKGKTNRRPPPRTADSGYSSGSSVRMADRDQQKSPLSTMSPDEEATPQQPPAVPISNQSADTSMSNNMLSPKSPRSVASRSSLDHTSTTTQRRLQRRRPSYPDLPVVQSCQSIPEGTIPDVPYNVRTKFARRLSDTPGIECLTQTYPSKNHVITSEPATDDTCISTREVAAQLAELEPERTPMVQATGRKRSLSLFRRHSSAEKEDVEKVDQSKELSVVHLGTIASSLGSSPYDAAMSGPLRQTVTSPTHPHQLGGALHRAKSMVNMEAKAASEFARVHSKDRIVEQEGSQRRRKSYHNLKADVGEAKASKRRPHSALHEIPPVPSIDMSKLTVPNAGRPRSKMTSSNSDSSASSRSRVSTARQSVDNYDLSGHSVPQQSVDWEAHARSWSQRRKSIGEGLRTQAAFSEASASTVNSRNQLQAREQLATWGRYSGGLDYNYEGRGAGVGGSAGTRQLHSAASKKSMHWRNQYGVDLSDVPIMLQRV
jgi:hypothetical protein